MALESGPVLIVVSEDGLNQDVDEDEEKEPEHKFVRIENLFYRLK